MKVEELKKTEKKQEYQDKLKETHDGVKEREVGELEEEWGLMKESLVRHASNMCEKRFVGGCMSRGSEWWNEGVKMKVEEKKRAFEEWLQCNGVEKYERYREKIEETKRKVEEAKWMSNFNPFASIGHTGTSKVRVPKSASQRTGTPTEISVSKVSL